MKIRVFYFKTSGEFYMEEAGHISNYWKNRFLEMDFVKERGKFMLEFREHLEKMIQHDEFIAVLAYQEGSLFSEMLGFPMMVMPKNMSGDK